MVCYGGEETGLWLNKVVAVAGAGAEAGSLYNTAAKASRGLRSTPTRLARSAEILTERQVAGLQRVGAEVAKRVAASKATYGTAKGIINMAISRSQALNRMEGLSVEVVKHLAKIAAKPLSRDVPHWTTEIRTWIGEIERLNQHVGKKTGQEWASRIAAWKGQLGD